MVKASSARPKEGYQQKWYEKGIIHSGRKVLSMAVPASYNDITVSQSLRYHVGAVWYERNFFVPGSWGRRRRTWLRFGSVHYKAEVWINGEPAMSHNSGSLPFEMEVGNYVNFGATNRLTVMCDNRQGGYTIPQGNNHEAEGNRTKERYTFEMYNAGIYRSVHLYSTPRIYISDIDVDTEYFSSEQLGVVRYRLFLDGDFYGKSRNRAYYIHVQLQNQESQVVAAQINRHPFRGSLQVHNVRAWWPFLMNPQPGYLYRLQVELHKGAYKGEESIDDEILDIYRLPVGIRSLMWNNDSLLLNGKNLYLRGFGRHEDFETRGRGLDYPMMLRDFNLLKWIGANAYHTTHYPYSEEFMQFADECGIMIIDEYSAVDIDANFLNRHLLENHMSVLEQLIHRDKNHPSVIAWSVANEPYSSSGSLMWYIRKIAQGRPLTAAISRPFHDDKKNNLAELLDIVGFNRYNSWYRDTRSLEGITGAVTEEALHWRKETGKPIIIMEYGANAINNYRSLPLVVGSPNYQRQLYSRHFLAFDTLRQKKWFIGEIVWNFADFQTAQTVSRVGGDRNGIFSRNRQPKEMAYVLRRRYYALSRHLDKAMVPRAHEERKMDWMVTFLKNVSTDSSSSLE
ncbi:beta-glucuronidase isoform X3 [Drosophila ananassae]|uniref:beta-glucuronidase isoform X3 n=1 Tax=Drosophila ananassae TaxID=7217 RepID=UPI0013A5D44B|nr:beta-glucuronidase isoform X3 [Drosophila ananassae]